MRSQSSPTALACYGSCWALTSDTVSEFTLSLGRRLHAAGGRAAGDGRIHHAQPAALDTPAAGRPAAELLAGLGHPARVL